MPILPFLPLIASGLGAVGDLISGNQARQDQKNINDDNIKFQRKQWEDTNAYNTPLAQKQRMLEAGMNPNLMYGNGTVANTASPSNVPQQQPLPKLQMPDASKYFDIQQRQAQTAITAKQMELITKQMESIDADIQLKNANTNEITSRTAINPIRAEREGLRLGIDKETYQSQTDAYKENLRRTQLQNESQQIQNSSLSERMQKQIQEATSRIGMNNQTKTTGQFESQIKQEMLKLYKMGLSPSDPSYMRIINKLINAVPPTMQEEIKTIIFNPIETTKNYGRKVGRMD